MALALLLYPLTLLLISQGAAGLPSHFFPVQTDSVTCNFPTYGASARFGTLPVRYAGSSETIIYIYRNGFLSFSEVAQSNVDPYDITNINLIAPMWTRTTINFGTVTFRQTIPGMTGDPDIDLATSVIKSMYPEYPDFAAYFVVVVTWDSVLLTESNNNATFQAVLISDGTLMFILFHYTAVAITQMWIPGFMTKSQTTFTYLPFNTLLDSTLVASTSNVGVPGRWAFEVESSINVYGNSYEKLQRIYNQHPVIPDANGNSPKVTFQQPFLYFGRNYTGIYINKNGFLSFSEITDPTPRNNTGMDIIAPLWYQFSSPNRNIFYEEITSGPTISNLNQYVLGRFVQLSVSISWAFLIAFDRVSFVNSTMTAVFEVILLSDTAGHSFIFYTYEITDGLLPPYTIGYETVKNIYNGYESRPALIITRVDSADCFSGTVTCGTDEVCGENNLMVGCCCDRIKPKNNPDVYDAVVTCNNGSGSVDLSRCQLFEGGYFQSDLHMEDTNCTGELQDNRLVFTFNNQDQICGGTYESNATHLIYNNSVSSVSGTISHVGGLYMSISCAYPLIQRISMPKSFQVTGGVINKELPSGNGTYQVVMQAYTSNAFADPYNGTAMLNVNQEIFIAVSVDGFNSTKVSTVLDSCWATPTNNSNDTVRWNLITNECPDPMETSVTVLQNGVNTSSNFSFNMFTFSGFSDSIHLHCQVHLCLLEGNTCTPSCTAGRRRRRVKNFHDTAAITMSF